MRTPGGGLDSGCCPKSGLGQCPVGLIVPIDRVSAKHPRPD